MSSDSFAMEDSSWSISACSGEPAKTAQSSSRFGVPKDHLNPRLEFILFHQFCLPKQHHLSCHCSIFLPGSPSSSVKPSDRGKRLPDTPGKTPPAPPSSCETFHLGRLLLFGSIVGGQLPGAKGFVLDLVGALGLEVGQILLEHLKTPHPQHGTTCESA